jgi:hypothetical protein
LQDPICAQNDLILQNAQSKVDDQY